MKVCPPEPVASFGWGTAGLYDDLYQLSFAGKREKQKSSYQSACRHPANFRLIFACNSPI